MKKICICLLLLILVGCSKGTNESNSNLVISYQGGASGVKDAIYDVIELYDDEKIVSSRTDLDGFRAKELSHEEYEEIINYAFSDNIKSLDGKDVGEEVEGGYCETIKLYKGLKKYVIKGCNIQNEDVNKLIDLLKKYK